MKNKIYKVGGMLMFTHLLITDDKLLFGLDSLKSIEGFNKEYNREGKVKAIKAIPIDRISNIEFKEGSSFTKITFTTDKGKVKSKNISFEPKELASIFSNYLGNERNLNKQVRDEKKWLVLLGNLALVAICIACFMYILDVDNFNAYLQEENSRSRSGRKAGTVKAILGLLGHKGSLGVLGIAGLLCGFNAFSEYKKPAQVVTYA